MEHVSILPWHTALKDARAAYIDHCDTWVSYLKSAATDPSRLHNPADSADISSTFGIAENRFMDGLPTWSRFDAEERIEEIWAD